MHMHTATVRLSPDVERVLVDLTQALRDIRDAPQGAETVALLGRIADHLEALLPESLQGVVEPVESALRVG